jgi:two-component system LytT family response regulator
MNASEIDWIEAAKYYACLHLGGDTHIVRRTDLEQDLDARRFFRIHRSIIVNLERVRGLELPPNVRSFRLRPLAIAARG